jgi:polyketide synthase Type III
MTSTTIISVASAFPPNSYSQAEVCALLGVTNPVVLRAAAAPHIHTRRLMLDAEPGSTDVLPQESLFQLDARFRRGVMTIGLEAAKSAMAKAGIAPEDVAVVVAVTSSGLALPGVSAVLIKELGVNRRAQRADLVGMGCNAGMSGLRTVSQLLASRPMGSIGLLLCCEINSALYVRNNEVGTGVVNSLFGDGAVATVVRSCPAVPAGPASAEPLSNASFNKSPAGAPTSPTDRQLRMVDFESATYPDLFDDMRYDVDESSQMYNFKLSKRIPLAVSEAVVEPVTEVLARHGLKPSDVRHWVVHSGGAAVINGVVKHLGLAPDALRHTVSVLKDYGNLSSGSVLVSYQRLLEENSSADGPVIRTDDCAVMIGMGPGATIEVGVGFFQ